MWDGFQGLPHAAGLCGAGRFRVRADGARRSAEAGAGAADRGLPANLAEKASQEWGEPMSDSQTHFASAAEKLEGWNRPAVIEPDGDGELLEVAMGRTILRRTASSAWMWRSTGSE